MKKEIDSYKLISVLLFVQGVSLFVMGVLFIARAFM